MRIHDVEQGSDEWRRLHLGIPTASEFDKIITAAKGELSKASKEYAYRLIAERLLRAPVLELNGIAYMDRGKALEPLAVRQYEFEHEVETQKVGFVTTDDGRIGCSPDRFVVRASGKGKKRKVQILGGVEVKCPAAHTHIGYIADGIDVKYRPQVQGQLLVAELDFVDLYSYHPMCPPVRIRTGRDEPFLKAMASALEQFNEGLEAMLERVKAAGTFQAFGSEPGVVEQAYGDQLTKAEPAPLVERLAADLAQGDMLGAR
jgi:hypothetical protein